MSHLKLQKKIVTDGNKLTLFSLESHQTQLQIVLKQHPYNAYFRKNSRQNYGNTVNQCVLRKA